METEQFEASYSDAVAQQSTAQTVTQKKKKEKKSKKMAMLESGVVSVKEAKPTSKAVGSQELLFQTSHLSFGAGADSSW